MGTQAILQGDTALWPKPVAFPGELLNFVVLSWQRAGVQLPWMKKWVGASNPAAAPSFSTQVTPWPCAVTE